MTGASFAASGATVRRPGRMVVLALVVMLEPLAGFVAFATGVKQPFLSYLSILAVLEAFALLAVAIASPRLLWGYGRPRATRVEVDAKGLHLDGKLVVPRGDIANVSTRPADGHLLVSVARHQLLGAIEIAIEDAPSAQALARSLDADAGLVSFAVDAEPLSPARRRARLVRAMVAAPIFAALGYVVATKLRAIMPVGLAPVIVAYVWVVLKRTRPARVTFGDDGIAVRVGKRAPRFVPFADVSSWAETARGASVVVGVGEHAETLAFRVAGLDASVEAQGQTLARMIDAGCTQCGAHARDETLESMLRRARMSTRDWLSSVRALDENRDRGYRHVALSEERLLAIVESASAASSARAAAALLLARTNVHLRDARERVTRAAERSATPGLRAALLATTSDAIADQEVEAALDRVEDAVTPRSAL